MMDVKELKSILLQDEDFKEIYNRKDLSDLKLRVGMMIEEMRFKRNLTQNELANRLSTRQSGVARWENGKQLPSLQSLQKIADALGTELLMPVFSDLYHDYLVRYPDYFNSHAVFTYFGLLTKGEIPSIIP